MNQGVSVGDQRSSRAKPFVWTEPRDRFPWLVWGACALIVGGVALRIFGLPSIGGLVDPLRALGLVCPLCGGTRATYVLASGDLAGSWSWNPVVPLLAAVVAVVLARAAIGSVSGRWVSVRLARRPVIACAVVGIVALELHQVLQADRLLNQGVG